MVEGNKFYIVENINTTSNGQYDRIWILEQVQNRPYFMRVTFLGQVMSGYHKIRNGGEYLVKSIAALKNFIQQTDRQSEMPMIVKESGENILKLYSHNLIEDALDLIEDGGIDGDESDES